MATITWLGGTDGNWDTTTNWDLARIPITGDDVDITNDTGGNNMTSGPSIGITVGSMSCNDTGLSGIQDFSNVNTSGSLTIGGMGFNEGADFLFGSVGGDVDISNSSYTACLLVCTSVAGTVTIHDTNTDSNAGLGGGTYNNIEIYGTANGIQISGITLNGNLSIDGECNNITSLSFGAGATVNIQGTIEGGDFRGIPNPVSLNGCNVEGGTVWLDSGTNVYGAYFQTEFGDINTGILNIYGSVSFNPGSYGNYGIGGCILMDGAGIASIGENDNEDAVGFSGQTVSGELLNGINYSATPPPVDVPLIGLEGLLAYPLS